MIALVSDSARATVAYLEEDVTRSGLRELMEGSRFEEVKLGHPESLLVTPLEVVREYDKEVEVRPRRENDTLLVVTELRQFHYPSVERIEIQPEDSLIAQAFVLRRFSYLRIGLKPGYVRDIKPSEVLQFRGRGLG